MGATILDLIANYGYEGIFIALILGIVGIPIPDETIMVFAGYLITKEHLNYSTTILVAFSGSVVGMTISFMIGRHLGLPFLEKYGSRIHLSPKKLERVESFFNRFGKYTVTFGYYIAGLRHLTALFAGISKWPYRTFALYAFPGGLVWVLIFVNLGYFLGDNWHHVYRIIHQYTSIVISVLAVVVATWWYLRKKRRKNVDQDQQEREYK